MISPQALFRCSLLISCFALLPQFSFAAQDFKIASVIISPNPFVTNSSQQSAVTVTIVRAPGFENNSVVVQVKCQTPFPCGTDVLFSAGQSTASVSFYSYPVAVDATYPVVATVNNPDGTLSDASTTSVTLQANYPTAQFVSTTLLAPGSIAVQVTLRAPLPANQSGVVAFSTSPSPPAANGGPCSIPPGGSSTTGCIVSSPGVSVPAETTFTPYLNIGSPSPYGSSTTIAVFPSSTVDPALSCGLGNCEAQVGHPVNVVNGNVWLTQGDYILPGLGGGLAISRTWNSLWTTSRDSLPAAGMFGDSWRSTYEERIANIDSNLIKFYRANGDAWWFLWNASAQTYQLINPPNQHASLVYTGPVSQYTIAFPDGARRVFNGSGYLTALLDRNGNQVSITYDSSNRITQVVDAASRTVNFTYANASFPSLATNATDAVGSLANYAYDSSGRLASVTYPDASQFNFAYDANNLLTTVTDALGKLIESHSYDTSRRGLTSQRANIVDAVTISYPSAGTTVMTDSLGNSTTYNYSRTGLSNFITSVNGPTCSSCTARNVGSFTRDASGNSISSTDANGNVTNYIYDAMGNVLTRSNVVNGSTLTWTYTYNGFGEVLTATDPLGLVTTKIYDANGNLLKTIIPSLDGVHSGSTTTLTYDIKGQLLTITDPLNNKTAISYFPAGLIQTITDAQSNITNSLYDLRGNRITTKDSLSNITQFSYDPMNRLTKITYPDTSATQFAYDKRGRRISVTDANGKVTTYSYDDADRLTSVKDAANNITSYGYDTENNLTTITDAKGNRTTFAYNSNRWVTRTTFPSGLAENYTYDLVGNLKTKTDRKNQTITYTYDQLNRLTQKTYPDTTTVNYTYDNDSRLTQVTDPTGTYKFTFDNVGRLTGETTSYTFLAGRNFTTSYSYDAASNRTGFTDPEGGATSYVYDTLNRLQALTPPSAFSGTGNFGFSYDALSRRTQMTRPNGLKSIYAYDNLSHLLSVLHQAGTTTLDGAAYTVDNAGNRTSRTPQPSGTASNYAYDAIYELTGVTQGVTTTESYTYDPVGNRLSSLGVSLYNYNASNELTSTSSATYTYDNNGNTLTKVDSTGTTTYTWDFENRLSSVTLPGTGGTVSFKYDPFGRRIYKSSSAGTSIFAYDGDNLVEQTDATGAVVTRYAQGLNIDEPFAMLATNIISNGGFEQGLSGWTTWGAGITAQLITNPATCHSGNNCLRLSSSTGGDAGITNSQQIPLTNGQTFSWGGWRYLESGVFSYSRWSVGVYALNGDANGAITYIQPFNNDTTLGQWVYQTGASYTVPNWALCPCHAVLYIDFLTSPTNYQNPPGPELNQARFDDGFISIGTAGGGSLYYLADGLGSITSLSDPGGTITATYAYDSFGKQTSSTGSLTNPFQYTAREFDPETGLYFYRARYYDPSTGRFLNEDPIGFKGGMDFYSYVRNTVPNVADSFGLRKNKCSWSGGCSDMPLPWLRKPCGSSPCKNNAVAQQIHKECNAYSDCVVQELGKNIAEGLAGDPLGALGHVKPPDPNPTHDGSDPIVVPGPEVGLADLLKTSQAAFLKALQDCFKQHPLAGLDPGFNAVDVGQESTGPTWFENVINVLVKVLPQPH